MNQTYVLYHANCPDGFGAAFAASRHLPHDTFYIPVRYNEQPPELETDAMIYVLDFSYPVDTVKTWLSQGSSAVILDHHATAERSLREISQLDPERVTVGFDLKESGATLTWRYFENTGVAEIPILYQYLRDRDLWEWKLEKSREISAGLRSYPARFKVWEQFLDPDILRSLVGEGTAILRHIDKMVRALTASAQWYRLGKYVVPCVNTSLYGSEVGNLLCEEGGVFRGPNRGAIHPHKGFAICYSMQNDGRWRYELRSVGECHVGNIAAEYGGGGHKNAAGFISDLWELGQPLKGDYSV